MQDLCLWVKILKSFDLSEKWDVICGKENIEMLTDKVCGKNKDIVDKAIVLNVYSHTCPDLTLIDLPGITLIPIAGQN